LQAVRRDRVTHTRRREHALAAFHSQMRMAMVVQETRTC
jgi:hypothetical protein